MKLKTPWLLLLGLILGLAVGLFYSWQLNPVQYYDTYPALLHRQYRADWIQLVAFGYSHDGNLERARILLRDIPSEEIQTQLTAALDKAIARGDKLPVLQRLATLAQEYEINNLVVNLYLDKQETELFVSPQSEITPTPTAAPATLAAPTRTPSPTPTLDPQQFSIVPTPTPPTSPYTISDTTRSCLPTPHIAISLTHQITSTEDKEQLTTQGLPGIDLWLLWTDGADHAVTGLRPTQGLGYVDFQVIPEQAYNLYINQPTGIPLTTLKVQPCQNGDKGWTSWLLKVHYQPVEQ